MPTTSIIAQLLRSCDERNAKNFFVVHISLSFHWSRRFPDHLEQIHAFVEGISELNSSLRQTYPLEVAEYVISLPLVHSYWNMWAIKRGLAPKQSKHCTVQSCCYGITSNLLYSTFFSICVPRTFTHNFAMVWKGVRCRKSDNIWELIPRLAVSRLLRWAYGITIMIVPVNERLGQDQYDLVN